MNKAVHLIVKGRVQGVGFRWFTRQEARNFKINGYVRNLPDGDVEIYAEGQTEHLDAFIVKVRQGPGFALVTDLEITDLPFENRYDSFEVAF